MTTLQFASIAPATDLRDHGIAVYNGMGMSLIPWRDAETRRDYVYVGINSPESVVVQIDVESGESRSFPLPAPCQGPRGITMTMEGHVLVPSVCGRLSRIDPKSGKVWVTAQPGKWLWGMDRGPDGKYYLAASPESRLFRYDANTEKIEDLGPVSPDEMYLRKIVGGNDGYIYCSVGCVKSQIVAYHIASGRLTPLLPKSQVGPYFLDTFGRGYDGQLYVRTNIGGSFRIEHGEAFPVKPLLDRKGEWRTGPIWTNCPTLPDGRKVLGLDPDAIRIGEGRKAKTISYTYKTGGANIFLLGEGPKKAVYGSTILPLYMLRYTPAKDKLENMGRGGSDNGEAYSLGHCDGVLYYANYSMARLMSYDPAKPLHKDPPGEMKWKTNPRDLGYLGKGNCRPRAMCIDSKKRVWVGGQPEYGYRHGGLACYDIKKKKLTVYDEVTPDQSVDALAADEKGDILYGASNIGRGGGMGTIAKESYLFAWDIKKKKVLWKLTPIPEMTGVGNLLYRDGKLYGTTGLSYFRFDPKTKTMDYVTKSLTGARAMSMQFGPDGNIYGITWMVMYRWRPQTGEIEELYRCAGDDAKPYPGGSLFWLGSAIIDGRFYFACGANVKSMKLPLEKVSK